MITVNENVATVLWGEPLPKLATQGVVMTIPLRVYAPGNRHWTADADRDRPR